MISLTASTLSVAAQSDSRLLTLQYDDNGGPGTDARSVSLSDLQQ